MPAKTKDDERPKQRRLRAPVRRAKILETTLEVFAERGYQTSMGELAEAAGITRTVLYYYFPSKKELFLAVLEAQLTELLRHLVPAVSGEGTQEQRGRATINALLAFAELNPRAWDVLFHLGDEEDAEVIEVRDRVHEATMAAAAQLVSADLTRWGVDPAERRTRMLQEMGFGALLAVVRWWRENPSVPREEVLDAIDMLTRGTLATLGAGKT